MSTDITQNLKQTAQSLKDSDLPQKALDKAQQVGTSITSGHTSLATTRDFKADYASLTVLSYERPTFLYETLESLHEAPGYPYELIIHDDGSEDYDTRQIVVEEAVYNGATVVLNKPGHNQGQGTSLNRMWDIASGDPIIKLDADIKYRPGWLLETIRLMRENPQIGMLGLTHYYYDPVDSRKTVVERHDDWSEHELILGSCYAMRRECYEELGPYSEHSEAFAEDNEMQVKVHESDKWVLALPKEALCENMGMGRITSTVVRNDMTIQSIHKEPYVFGKE